MIYGNDNIHDALEKVAVEVKAGKGGITASTGSSSITVRGNLPKQSVGATIKQKLTPKLSLVGEGTVSPERQYGGLKLTGHFGGKRK